MIPFLSGSCLSKLEHVKANSMEVAKILTIIMLPRRNISTLALFAFTRFYFRVLADGNGIILRLKLKRNVILRIRSLRNPDYGDSDKDFFRNQ